MQNKKMLVASLVLTAAFVAIGADAKTETKTQKTTWKDYFTQDEAKMIKKLTQNYIINQLDENADDWKGVISSKIVDGSIAKKKVFTGSITCSVAFADKSVVDGGDTEYFKKISFDKITLSNPPVVQRYSKVTVDGDLGYLTQLDANIWSVETSIVSEGAVWVSFGSDLGDGIKCSTSEYKVVINY